MFKPYSRVHQGRAPVGLFLLGALAGCASAPGGRGVQTVDPQSPETSVGLEELHQEALLVEHFTGPVRASQIRFDWSWNEAGSRTGGRGVARVEAPYKARLDLFMEKNLEQVAAAAIVGDDRRIPGGSEEEEAMVPPGPLLWATLGVFRPGRASELIGGSKDGSEVELRYRTEQGDDLLYRLERRVIQRVELIRNGNVVERIELESAENGPLPEGATYRNLSEFRELKVEVDSVTQIDGFPPDIWTIGG